MPTGNESTLWHLMQLSGASLLNADYASHHFAPHYHEELAIGVIQRGKLHVQIGKHGRMTLCSSDIVIINAGEIHEGFADEQEGCVYRMFYLPSKLLGKAIGSGDEYYPHFATCAINDAPASKQLTWLHSSLTTPAISLLEVEGYLLDTLNGLIGRYADSGGQTTLHAAPELMMIEQAQAYLAAHYDEKVSLETLSAQIGLSPFHFLRSFKAAVGMTPHAFQMQMRIEHAKSQLISGEAIANVAADLGFHDQSHLTKHFKAVVGVTPQRYRQNRNFLQDNFPPTP